MFLLGSFIIVFFWVCFDGYHVSLVVCSMVVCIIVVLLQNSGLCLPLAGVAVVECTTFFVMLETSHCRVGDQCWPHVIITYSRVDGKPKKNTKFCWGLARCWAAPLS